MGLNTTVVILNDALYDIENDPEFGRNLARAIYKLQANSTENVYTRHGLAAKVVNCSHANNYVTIKVGGNTGEVINNKFDFEKYWESTGIKTEPEIMGLAFKECAKNAVDAVLKFERK